MLGDDGPMIGAAAGFNCAGIEIIIIAPNRALLEKVAQLSKTQLQDNVYEALLAPMDNVELVNEPRRKENGRVH